MSEVIRCEESVEDILGFAQQLALAGAVEAWYRVQFDGMNQAGTEV